MSPMPALKDSPKQNARDNGKIAGGTHYGRVWTVLLLIDIPTQQVKPSTSLSFHG
jgi:hypothetical protein